MAFQELQLQLCIWHYRNLFIVTREDVGVWNSLLKKEIIRFELKYKVETG